MPDNEDAGFFRNLSGLATEYVKQKRKSLQSTPTTNVDSTGSSTRYNFQGQDHTWDDLRDIKDIRDSGGQVAQLYEYKALLNFGEGAEIHVEDEEDEHTELVDGEELTLTEWLERQFPDLDLLVLDLGTDALWYPAAYGEIRETITGDFKEALPAEPWTIIPITDESGEIVAYRQRTKQPGGGYREETLSVDDVWNIAINKASARDKTGISEVLRNREEIQAFKENEQAINNAIELHGFPQRHVKVGREEGAPVSDDDLRRVRTIFDPRTSDANTAYFTGQDVDVEALEAEQFEYSAIHEMDMRNLTTALGLPLEAGNVGSDGLGSGKPAELRFSLLKLAIKANQRSFSTQFVSEVMRPVIRDYSPFDHTANVTLDIGDPLEDIGEMADVINQIGDYMTNNQVARKLDLPEPEDDEVGEAYRSPADIEKSEAGDPVDEGPFGGMFEDRSLGGSGNANSVHHGITQEELEAAPDWDRSLLEIYQGVTNPDTDPNRALVSFSSSGTPEFVLNRIREAIMNGSIFSDIDGISGSELMDFRQEFADALATDNFSVEDVTQVVMDYTGEDRQSAQVAARTELGNTLKHAREDGYKEEGAEGERFYWTGADPGDPRQTDACGYLIAGSGGHLENPGAFSGLPRSDGTNPFHGGEPLPMDELKDLVEDAARADPEINTEPRTWTPHIQCRSTFVLEPSEGI